MKLNRKHNAFNKDKKLTHTRDSKNKKMSVVSVRFTPKEKEELRKLAGENMLKLSDFIRHRVFCYPVIAQENVELRSRLRLP